MEKHEFLILHYILQSVQLLGNAKFKDINDLTKEDGLAEFVTIYRGSNAIGLAINKSNTNYMLLTNIDKERVEFRITTNN